MDGSKILHNPDNTIHASAREVDKLKVRIQELEEVYKAARDLYDNRLGWSDGRNPYAPKAFWARLAETLKGVE